MARFELTLDRLQSLGSPRNDDQIVARGRQALRISSTNAGGRACDKGGVGGALIWQ